MNILRALRWSISAWDDIEQSTIQRCRLKARVISAKYGPETEADAKAKGWIDRALIDQDQDKALDFTVVQLTNQIQALKDQQRIKTAMSVDAFLNPIQEQVEDSKEAVIDDIVAAHIAGDREYETDEEEVSVARIQENEALQLLYHLHLYEEQQEGENGGDSEVLVCLNKYKGKIRRRQAGMQVQTSISSYLTQI